jgi:hypothetical protein
LPIAVTVPVRRAIWPSSQSVDAATVKSANAKTSLSPLIRTAKKNGTSISRKTVTMLAIV